MILLVEDNPVFRASLRRMLCTRFPSLCIHEADDAPQALQKIDAIIPDLIFTDIRLPGSSGLELTRWIKSSNRDVVIVVFTSYDLPEYRDAAFRCGADYFLTKGVATSDEITSLVEAILPMISRAGAARPGDDWSVG